MSFVDGQTCHLENKGATVGGSREARPETGEITWVCSHSVSRANYKDFAECVNLDILGQRSPVPALAASSLKFLVILA